MTDEQIYKSDGINWDWYCHVVLEENGTVRVVKEYRLHKYDDWQGAGKHPKNIAGEYRVIEVTEQNDAGLNDRIAVGINLSGKAYLLNKRCSRFDLGK